MPEEAFQRKGNETFSNSQMVRDWLRKPFRPEQIGKLPATQKRPALDFVGHAAVTDRLNKIAPDWSYTVDTMSTIGDKVWIRGTMTIGGISRPEFGDGDDPKEAIGNFIRRGAMRFGVAIDLWSREELESSAGSGEGPADEVGPGESPPRGTQQAKTETSSGPTTKFPLRPEDCDHKSQAGHWLPTKVIDGVPHCPRCGESALIYRETA